MATIESLGSVLFSRLTQTKQLPLRQSEGAQKPPEVSVKGIATERRIEEAKSPVKPRTRGNQRDIGADSGSRSRPVETRKHMSSSELAEILRKVNLTFDLFEIQAFINVDRESGEVTVQVINQRTGEVIRKIPPYDLPKIIEALDKGTPNQGGSVEGLITDIKV